MLYKDLKNTHNLNCPIGERRIDDLSTKKRMRKLAMALFFCGILTIVELTGSYYSGSLAILSDAAHVATDMIAFGINIIALTISIRRPTQKYSFGYGRVEIVGALASIGAVFILVLLLITESIHRFFNPIEISSLAMIFTALFAFLFNGVLLMFLSHEGDSNISIRSAVIHAIGDILHALGVLFASLIIYFWPSLASIDLICTIIFSLITIYTTFSITKESLHILLEGSWDSSLCKNYIKDLITIPGVKKIQDIHTWSISNDQTVATVHLIITDMDKYSDIMQQCHHIGYVKYSLSHQTIQLMLKDEDIVNMDAV